MKQQWMAGLAAVALAAGLLLMGAPASAQPRRDHEMGPRATTGSGLLPQRTTPGMIPGARTPSASARYRFAPRAAFPRARRLQFRRRYAAPYAYYYAPPPAYYYSPPVAYYYAPPSGNYYYTSAHGRRRHQRHRYRVAGYRGYYAARARRVRHHGRR